MKFEGIKLKKMRGKIFYRLYPQCRTAILAVFDRLDLTKWERGFVIAKQRPEEVTTLSYFMFGMMMTCPAFKSFSLVILSRLAS